MSLKEKISTDLKNAMKAKEKERVSVLRMLLSEVKYAQAANNAQEELPEAEVLKVIGTYHKRLVKSLDDFPDEGKKAEIRSEIAIVEVYLPKKASPEEVAKAIEEVMSGTEDRNFGILMKAVMAKLGSAADGKMISQQLKEKLAN